MGQTSNPTLRYPDGTDRPRATQLKDLAEDTHAAFIAERDYRPVALPAFVAASATGDTVGTTHRTLGSVAVPSRPHNGTIIVNAHAYFHLQTANAAPNLKLVHVVGGATTDLAWSSWRGASGEIVTASLTGRVDTNAGQASTLNLVANTDAGTALLSFHFGRVGMTGIWVPR